MYGELFNKNNLTEFIKTMVDDDEERNTNMTTKQPHETDNFGEGFKKENMELYRGNKRRSGSHYSFEK